MKATVAIHIRVPPEQVRLMKRAARMENKKLATFVRDAALACAAERVVRDQSLTMVNP